VALYLHPNVFMAWCLLKNRVSFILHLPYETWKGTHNDKLTVLRVKTLDECACNWMGMIYVGIYKNVHNFNEKFPRMSSKF
jgi:hypothetical protein